MNKQRKPRALTRLGLATAALLGVGAYCPIPICVPYKVEVEVPIEQPCDNCEPQCVMSQEMNEVEDYVLANIPRTEGTDALYIVDKEGDNFVHAKLKRQDNFMDVPEDYWVKNGKSPEWIVSVAGQNLGGIEKMTSGVGGYNLLNKAYFVVNASDCDGSKTDLENKVFSVSVYQTGNQTSDANYQQEIRSTSEANYGVSAEY